VTAPGVQLDHDVNQATPAIDGSGVCHFALSALVVAYNLAVVDDGRQTLNETTPGGSFAALCATARQRMKSLYTEMTPDDNAAHFVCTRADISLLLTTMRGLSSMTRRTQILFNPAQHRNLLQHIVDWVTQAMQVYMSFESTLVIWTILAAKVLLQPIDLALCATNRDVLARVRLPDYVSEWETLVSNMQSFAMVQSSDQQRAQELHKHDIGALFATLLQKHVSGSTVWTNVICWDNDTLPAWCSATTTHTVPGGRPPRRRKRPDAFACVLIRRADHWVVQTRETYQLCPTLLHAIALWITHVAGIPTRELQLSGMDASVLALVQRIYKGGCHL
jgi:hypothetical protein